MRLWSHEQGRVFIAAFVAIEQGLRPTAEAQQGSWLASSHLGRPCCSGGVQSK